jgi:hypothetical protein
MPGFVIARFTAHVGENIRLVQGQLWHADDVLVRDHPEWFDADLTNYALGTAAPVEQATAAPGERRTTTKTAER